MNDLILENRLLALKQYLTHIQEIPNLLTRRDTQNPHLLSRTRRLLHNRERLWHIISQAITRETRRQIDAAQKIQDKLNLAERAPQAMAEPSIREAWREYDVLSGQCQGVFRECMDLLSGLAFREITLDDSICELADELIDKCSMSVGRAPGLAFPACQEPLLKVLRRVVRVPFPEWSIWTLPLIAHEYGHVVVGDPTDDQLILQPFADRRAARPRNWDADYWNVLNDPASTTEAKIDAERLAAERGLFRVKEYMADAFGTYVMGPAFACASLRLRLNPCGAPGTDPYPGLDRERAIVILGMLRKMDSTHGRFRPVVDQLEKDWRESRRVSVTRTSPVEKTKEKKLLRLVDEIQEIFLADLTDIPMYKDRDWTVAEGWANQWIDDARVKMPSVPADAGPDHTLRDVLNAAWLWRIRSGSSDRRILEDVARRTCRAVMGTKTSDTPVPAVGSNTPFD